MDLALTVLGHVFTLCGALVALVGDTWDTRRPRFRRLTTVGWFAAAIACVGMGLSIHQSYDKHQTENMFRELALDDISGGWRQVASPWALTLWEVTDADSVPVSVATLGLILDGGHLEAFDEIDLGMTSRVAEYGDRTLGILYCQQSAQGMGIMERAVQYNMTVLPRDVAAAVRQLRQEPMFGRFLTAGCGNRRRDEPDYSRLLGEFSAMEGRSYLSRLLTLGELLEAR